MAPESDRPPRRDKRRNRDALLAAARHEVAEHGPGAPLERIAKRAGVGVATLYRHFPTRTALINELFTHSVNDRITIVGQALDMPDPWQGFSYFLEYMAEALATDRAWRGLALTRMPGAEGTETARPTYHRLIDTLIERGRRDGTIRPDLAGPDIMLVAVAIAGVATYTEDVAPHAWRRFLHLLIDAFRAERAHQVPVPPLTHEQAFQTLVANARRWHGAVPEGPSTPDAPGAPEGPSLPDSVSLPEAPGAPEPDPDPPPRRAKQHNRNALLMAARHEFATHGLGAPLERIARRAGVGIATLYRRFPTRAALIDALFTHAVAERIEIVERALDMPDPWQGFTYYLEKIGESLGTNRAVRDLMLSRIPTATGPDQARPKYHELVDELIERGQRSGQIRADLAGPDMMLVAVVIGNVAQYTEEVAPEIWRRFLHLLVDAFRAGQTHELPVPPLDHDQAYRVLLARARNWRGAVPDSDPTPGDG